MSPVLTQYVSQPITLDEQTQKMKQHLLQDIRRSAYVYRVDCGGCNACEIEIFAAITPVFDAERFGIKVISSPRHADILLFTGAVTRAMRMPALRVCFGSSITNLHPPYSRFSALIVPPALSTIRFTSARPRPFPSAL